MLIGDKYKIESDSLNITLYRKGVSKANGNTYWRPIAYFATVENALIGLADLAIAETGLKDFRTVVAKQTEIFQLIRGLENNPEASQRVRGAKK